MEKRRRLCAPALAGPSKASTNEYILDVALGKANLGPKDVAYLEMSFGDMGAAFANKGIDAAVGSEPTATRYDRKGLAKKWLAASEMSPNIQFTFLPANAEIQVDTIRDEIAWARDRGDIDEEPNLDKLVDQRFVRAAIQQLGRYTGT